jgi:RimJ/RimL family protein N-acetyltransferase
LSDATVHFYEPYTQPTLETMREVVARAIAGRDLALVLEAPGGDIVGHAFLSEVGAPEPTLGIGLADAWQNRGYGPRLMGRLLAQADARPGVQAVLLTVNKQNARALKMYLRFGFAIDGECDHRAPDDSYRMRRRRPRSVAPPINGDGHRRL